VIGTGSYEGARALVTGGAGFIGSAIARALCAMGAEVTIIDSLDPDFGGNLFNISPIRARIRLAIADLRDEAELRKVVTGQDYIFNLAAQIGHTASMREPLRDLDINTRAQLSLLECCRELNPNVRIVFASTRQLYGRPEHLPVDETHPVHPVDVNGISKFAAEQFHLLYTRVYGLKSTVLRLTNTYGPGMRIRDARQTFVGVWVRAMIEGEPFQVWGGSQIRDLTYVDDAVDAFMRVAGTESTVGEVYNVGGGRSFTLSELAETLIDVNGGGAFTTRALPDEVRRIDIGDFYANAARIAAAVGWHPRIDLRDGLTRTLSYYRQYLSHYVGTPVGYVA
jgi:UDP-glucose 4-epimerase